MRLYSEEWIAAFNEAVRGLEADPHVSLRMLQVVQGGPEGTVRVLLRVQEGRVSLERAAAGQPGEPAPVPAPQVTVSVQFDDALALSRGELDPAGLLAAGRVKVRGDLSVLVTGQEILAAAAPRLDALSERTTS